MGVDKKRSPGGSLMRDCFRGLAWEELEKLGFCLAAIWERGAGSPRRARAMMLFRLQTPACGQRGRACTHGHRHAAHSVGKARWDILVGGPDIYDPTQVGDRETPQDPLRIEG